MSHPRPRRRPQSFSQRFWEDGQGNVVVWQTPNRFLYTWIVTTVIGWFLPFGWFERFVSLVSLVAIVIWAILEAWKGINYFRRLLGILVLVALLITHFL
ncbi:MAG TPA: hypothetical protein VLF90_02945 [Patescibacteria group bacterium]|nr:hypothetical protein [Patescibacteria group bacterium]